MRSAVNALLSWHKGFRSPDLLRKLKKMRDTPFGFFRGSYFLYAADTTKGPFGYEPLDAVGPIVGDIHGENYGAYRAVTNEIVYDINDFDDTAESAYEYDVRRMAVSLVLAAADNHHRLGDGLNAAEACVRGWLHALRHWSLHKRGGFAEIEQHHHVRELLASAEEVNRAEFLRGLATQVGPGQFALKHDKEYRPVDAVVRARVEKALPQFLRECVAPRNAKPAAYRLQDVAARTAGTGSLGRVRLALLMDKGEAKVDWGTLRLIEWKEALDSALDVPKPGCSKGRARRVVEATTRFQLTPKRYLGFTRLAGMPVQAREIGANDQRFSHQHFADLERFTQAAVLFGGILARAHLLGSPGKGGPRAIPKLVGVREDQWVNRVLSFAGTYASQVQADWEELESRRGEVEKAWQAQA